jgi:hypothetical protein
MSKRTQFRKPNGQWRKSTLRDFGFRDSEINQNGALIKCEKCGLESRPVLLNGWLCQCGHKNGNKK